MKIQVRLTFTQFVRKKILLPPIRQHIRTTPELCVHISMFVFIIRIGNIHTYIFYVYAIESNKPNQIAADLLVSVLQAIHSIRLPPRFIRCSPHQQNNKRSSSMHEVKWFWFSISPAKCVKNVHETCTRHRYLNTLNSCTITSRKK